MLHGAQNEATAQLKSILSMHPNAEDDHHHTRAEQPPAQSGSLSDAESKPAAPSVPSVSAAAATSTSSSHVGQKRKRSEEGDASHNAQLGFFVSSTNTFDLSGLV